MTDWQIAGVLWLALSVVLAPLVGRMIHGRDTCPVCIERDRKRSRRG
jgi:membrane protein implicated in regulation of membrane protease activity